MRVKLNHGEPFRYILNGCIATIFHYIVLSFSIEIFELHSAAIANLIASFFAITFSYVGNRYFVFRSISEPIFKQYYKFLYFYVVIAAIHGSVLFIWTDYLGFDYKVGFLLAVMIQVILGYFANKKSVFSFKEFSQ